MDRQPSPEELIEFPCDYIFKAMGPNEETFFNAVRAAVAQTVPVSQDAMKIRRSSGGKWASVSVVVRLHNYSQVRQIYADLRSIEGIRFML